jgi:hypothetical protein
MTTEHLRLEEARKRNVAWKKWGPYLSERQWGTVREDYSENGDAWNFFTHDHARSRAYRWGEDGLAGISDEKQRLCFALALASAVPERKDTQRESRRDSFLYKVGEECLAFCRSTTELLEFIGEVLLAFFNLLRGRARCRFRDLALNFQECGAQALPERSIRRNEQSLRLTRRASQR